jgi:hypothetical protein
MTGLGFVRVTYRLQDSTLGKRCPTQWLRGSLASNKHLSQRQEDHCFNRHLLRAKTDVDSLGDRRKHLSRQYEAGTVLTFILENGSFCAKSLRTSYLPRITFPHLALKPNQQDHVTISLSRPGGRSQHSYSPDSLRSHSLWLPSARHISRKEIPNHTLPTRNSASQTHPDRDRRPSLPTGCLARSSGHRIALRFN